MSQTEDAFMQQFEEDGTADWIRQMSGQEVAQDADTEAPDEDTAEVEEEVAPEDSAEEEIPADVGIEPEEESQEPAPDAEAEEEIFLDLTPETEAYLAKYGGDLNKALKAAHDAQSLIGRQGNELGDVRSELQALRAEIQAGINRPSLVWPDEFAEPEEAVPMLRQIADSAFEMQDARSFEQAMNQWKAIDPLGNEAWATMKATQVMLSQAPERATPETPTLEAGVAALQEKYPQISEPEFQKEVGAELDKFPTLQRTFHDTTAAPSERLGALEEAARLVASRHSDGDVRQAVRRVAVKQSEEARKSRAEARVATGGGQGKPTAPAERTILVGDTGQTVTAEELQARVKELTGMDIEVGGTTWKPPSER